MQSDLQSALFDWPILTFDSNNVDSANHLRLRVNHPSHCVRQVWNEVCLARFGILIVIIEVDVGNHLLL